MDDKDVGPGGVASESVEEWLQEIADAEGLSREETLEDLVSSYWRLEEIFHLLQDTGIEFEQSERSKEEFRTAKASDLEDLRNRVEQLSEKLETLQTNPAASKRDLRRAVSNLETQIEEVSDEVSDVSKLSDLLEGPLSQPDELVSRLSTLESRMDRVETKYTSVDERVGEVDNRVGTVAENTVSKDHFESYAKESEAVHDSMRREHESLKERIRSEFGNIRTILTHLLETSGRGENHQQQSNRQFEADYRRHLNDQETLSALLRRANREDIRTADCSECGQTIDLSLLEDPICPHCERPFGRIERKSRYWGLGRRHLLKSSDHSTEE